MTTMLTESERLMICEFVRRYATWAITLNWHTPWHGPARALLTVGYLHRTDWFDDYPHYYDQVELREWPSISGGGVFMSDEFMAYQREVMAEVTGAKMPLSLPMED